MFFNIQRWSLHDGPGIRTTVFFKGCPLRCRWCSNPESWSFDEQLLFMKERCCGCGACIDVCPRNANTPDGGHVAVDRDKCVACGQCAQVCPQHARECIGRELPVDQVMKMLERDAVFYRSSDGGVTFSGGEPFARMDLLRRLAGACVFAGIRTTVETSGFFPLKEAIGIFDWIDEIFIDVKHTDDIIHRKLTGVSNKPILENIVALDKMGRRLTIRIPLIKDLTSSAENIEGVIELCSRLQNPAAIELLPYHGLGAGKYAALGLSYASGMAAPGRRTIERILDRLRARGLDAACPGSATAAQA
jgi:pyruvate formate lyase activating enzyme